MTSDLASPFRPTSITTSAGLLMVAVVRVLVWFVPIAFAVPVVLYTLVALLGGELGGGGITMGIAANAPMWFLFAKGASLATEHLPVHVAHGMTRRSLATALTVTIVAAALLLASLMPIGLAIEAATLDALGWTRGADGVVPSIGTVGALVANVFARCLAMGFIGVVAAITYYRYGAWWGTLVAAATVAAPAVVVLYLLGDLGASVAPSARAVLVAATVVAVVAAQYALISGATIRGKPA